MWKSYCVNIYTWEKKDQKTGIDQESVNWKQLKTLGYQEGSAGLDTKPEAPNLIPRTPMVEGEKQLSQVVFWSSHMYLELKVWTVVCSHAGSQD